MSLGIQRHLRQRRQYGSTRLFDKQIYADQYIMSNLTLERELPGHTGCVNTLDWSSAGDKLLTGSDDTKLNVYLTFENYELQTTIDTGHRANIFTAKFMPQTSDNIIVSGAGDSEIRIFDLTNPEKQLDSMYVCHSDQLKRICVFEDNPYEFMSCSQDGTVRHFDRRTPHLCSPHNVRSFITAQSKPARQHPLPDSKDARRGCPSPIVNYGRYNIELNSMTISKLFPHYFAVAGMNDYIYLHDRRMTNSSNVSFSTSSSSSHQMMDKLKCIKRFSPTIDGLNRPDKHITACKFSDTNGYELLGSWSSDGIYLFNINDDTIQSSISTNTSTSHTRNKTASDNSPSSDAVDLLQQKKEAWENIVSFMESGLASSAVDSLYDLLQEKHPSIMDLDGRIGVACVYMMEAHLVCKLRTRRDTWYTNEVEDPEAAWSRYFFAHELTQIQKKMEDAEALVLPTKTWQAYWCLAIGYWTLRGGHETIANHNRQAVLDKALDYANKAMDTFKQAAEVASSSSSSSSTTMADTSNLSQIDGTYLAMMQLFIIDWQHAAVREGALTNEEIEIEENGISGWPWERLMYITLYSPDEIEDFFMRKITEGIGESEASTSSSSTSSLTSNEEDEDMEEEEDEDEEMTEDEVSLYTRIMSRQIMDIYRGNSIGDDSDDSDLDLEELAVLRESAQKPVEADVGVVKPRVKYMGHCNIETIKDVDFFGPNDEYIVSGSDGGYLFIWDKKTAKILQILQADQDIVNVAKGHPTLPILAVSGIDSTTKIFTPTSKPHTTLKSKEPNNPNSYSASSHMYEEQAIVSLNRENTQTLGTDIYITRNMIAALSRISRVHRLRRNSDEDEDEDENGENDDEHYDSNGDDSDGPSRLYRMIEEGLLDEDL
ncbi:Transcription initiation factor TFIID subunit 9 [Mucor velutinosus]|uniref:Transcription initiation factor TFIID subunit 9 n=1 Tax=Mucor velutinosus TaxID=708070 RepID=A0AAN7I2B6_9FUNG|nr:Transcription initiation factor TFIID subunit 9 [Mucor velutinosus]